MPGKCTDNAAGHRGGAGLGLDGEKTALTNDIWRTHSWDGQVKRLQRSKDSGLKGVKHPVITRNS